MNVQFGRTFCPSILLNGRTNTRIDRNLSVVRLLLRTLELERTGYESTNVGMCKLERTGYDSTNAGMCTLERTGYALV